MPSLMDDSDDECVGEAVTHQRRHRRTQTGAIVINAFALAYEGQKLVLLSEKYPERVVNCRRVCRLEYFWRWKPSRGLRNDLLNQQATHECGTIRNGASRG